ncbi:proline-rich protein 4-like [Haliotis rufescens]|uniref:proline-rich protein 4-like n=1 Tax=Haliotis rufescens TaxID=6454 RepID=UPI00201EFF5C|nr:proline-rich protein 4-like [Haliotis rufescens]
MTALMISTCFTFPVLTYPFFRQQAHVFLISPTTSIANPTLSTIVTTPPPPALHHPNPSTIVTNPPSSPIHPPPPAPTSPPLHHPTPSTIVNTPPPQPSSPPLPTPFTIEDALYLPRHNSEHDPIQIWVCPIWLLQLPCYRQQTDIPVLIALMYDSRQ